MRVVANANMRHFFIFFRSWLPPRFLGGRCFTFCRYIFSYVPKIAGCSNEKLLYFIFSVSKQGGGQKNSPLFRRQSNSSP